MDKLSNEKVRYASIDGVNYAVPSSFRYVFACHRGFLHAKFRSPEIVKTGRIHEWTPEKVTLHAQSDKFRLLWPVRISEVGVEGWKDKVYSTTEELTNPNLPLVDCTEYKYKDVN